MSADMLMLRGEVDGGWNLQVGEPVFLQKALGDLSRYHLKPPDMRYPPFAGTGSLIQALQQYHGEQYEHFVVTVGAKQALVAAFHALGQLEGTDRVYAKPPYWPSYPTLVKSVGMHHMTVRSRPVAKDIVVNTTPNNPDGGISMRSCDIWDCAYAHPVYGWDHLREGPEHRCAVFSGAKLLGLSGLRIGWLATNDGDLARLAGEYIEKATSGVSTLDQYALEGIIAAAYTGILGTRYDEARRILDTNISTYWNALGKHLANDAGACSDGVGMFAWLKPKSLGAFDRALETANVKVIPGTACGVGVSHYRMSLGHEPAYTLQALTALKNALENDR